MKRRYSKEQKAASARQSLDRATQNVSFTNYPAIIEGCLAMGIPESEIRPRENVFSFNAWKALGRSVKKGEHGIKVVTWIEGEKEKEDGAKEKYRFSRTAYVFHVSQTQPIGAKTEVETASVVETSDCRELICV